MTENNTPSTNSDPTKSVVIERTFDAPIQLVWDMWTDADHFAAWYGPMGARIPVAKMDVTVGGKRHVCMEMDTPNGAMQMWFVGEYLEVSPHTRLVYTESMSNADGDIMSAADMGMPEGMPSTTEIVVELADSDGKTDMVMTHVGVAADSPGAQGWNMALDKLAARIAEAT
jgi:uncharacterized protein YndB with AHSA1/START domain